MSMEPAMVRPEPGERPEAGDTASPLQAGAIPNGATSEVAAPQEVDVPSIPSGSAGNEPPRPTAPMALPPAAPPPTGQEVNALETEPASLEPPDSIAAEPMAPPPHEERSLGDDQPSVAFEEVQPRADVTPQPEAARAPQPEPHHEPHPEPEPARAPQPAPAAAEAAIPGADLAPAMAEAVVTAPVTAEVTVLPDEPPAETASIAPPAAAASHDHADVFDDRVTLLDISPPDGGGITEAALPGNRAGSPPPPLPARRIGWNHPVARWAAYALMVVALTFLFLWLLVDLFHVG